MQQLEGFEVHANVRTELDATLQAPSASQGLGEEIEVGCEQGVTLVSLDIFGSKITGPKRLLFSFIVHVLRLSLSLITFIIISASSQSSGVSMSCTR